MSAQAEIEARPQIAWQTLTDYEHLPRFIPGIRSARVVDERGDAHFFIFGQSVRIRMDVHQVAPSEITAHSVPWPPSSGDPAGEVEPESFSATYRLQPTESGVRLVYEARIVPASDWPAMVERLALRQNAALQFGALVAEINRRAHAAAERTVQ